MRLQLTLVYLIQLHRVLCAPVRDNLIDENENSIENSASSNDYVDEIIDAFRSSIGSKLDPLEIGYEKIGFDRKILGIRFHGDALIKYGELHGLRNVHRSGKAYLGHQGMDKVADVRIGVENLNFTGLTKVSFLGYTKSSDILVNIDHFEAKVRAHLNKQSGEPVLEQVKVEQLSGISVHLPGLGFWSKPVQFATRAIVAAFKGTIKSQIEKKISDVAEEAIKRNRMKMF
ncbi:hypothetical protein HDE_08461 [Halotydeus destructor]|nr:hypothetical protein HDE_08461 [Halotydeus destructor]